MDPRPALSGVRDLVMTRLLAVLAFLGRTLTDPIAGVVVLVVGLGVAGLMTAVAARVYDAVTEQDGVAGLDRPVLNLMLEARSPELDEAATWFTDLGGTRVLPFLTTGAVIALALIWRRWTPVLVVVTATAGSLLMTIVGKAAVGRDRPPPIDAVAPYEDSYSFPSGHTLNTTVVVGAIAYLILARQPRRSIRIAAIAVAGLLAVAMGLSRVFLGHHWLTDVLGAWALGLSWLALVITGHQLWQLRLPAQDRTAATPTARGSTSGPPDRDD